MTVTIVSQVRSGPATIFEVQSDLVPGAGERVIFHWYVNGAYIGGGFRASRTIGLALNERASIDIVDTLDPDFDPLSEANRPEGYPTRKTLSWCRSLEEDIAQYRVEQRQFDADANEWGAWAVLAVVPNRGEWAYRSRTGILRDLAVYQWRIVPVDLAGNQGDPLTMQPERMVRRPDAPLFEIALDTGSMATISVVDGGAE